MMRPIFFAFVVACFAIVALPDQAQSAQSRKCDKQKSACYNQCTERAIPGEGTEVTCQAECNRWFNVCRGKGHGPTKRNKSQNKRR